MKTHISFLTIILFTTSIVTHASQEPTQPSMNRETEIAIIKQKARYARYEESDLCAHGVVGCVAAPFLITTKPCTALAFCLAGSYLCTLGYQESKKAQELEHQAQELLNLKKSN